MRVVTVCVYVRVSCWSVCTVRVVTDVCLCAVFVMELC